MQISDLIKLYSITKEQNEVLKCKNILRLLELIEEKQEIIDKSGKNKLSEAEMAENTDLINDLMKLEKENLKLAKCLKEELAIRIGKIKEGQKALKGYSISNQGNSFYIDKKK